MKGPHAVDRGLPGLLLDTHILIWWYLDSEDLPAKMHALLDQYEAQRASVSISVISLWEIAQLAARGRIRFSVALDQWFAELESDPWLQVLPLSSGIILESTRLGDDFHKDPADRLIVATARIEKLSLVTMDKQIRASGAVSLAGGTHRY